MAGFNTAYNYDLEKEGLDRRQQMIAAMQAGALQPLQLGPAAGGVQPRMSMISALAPMLQALMAGKAQQGLQADRASLANQYQTDLRNGMEQYLNTSQGQTKTFDMPAGVGPEAAAAGEDAPAAFVPGQSTSQTPGGGTEVTAPDPRKAMLDAIASNHPVLQQLGMSQLTALGKDRLTQKDILSLSGFDPKTRLAAAQAGNIGLLSPERKEHVVNGQIVVGNPDAGYASGGDFRDKFGGVGPVAQGPNGPIIGQANSGTGEVKFAPAGTNVNVNTTQKAGEKFATELAGKRADTLAKSFDTAQAAAKALDAIQTAEGDFAAGIKSGATANISLALAKVGKSLGVPGADDPSIANTEAFRATMARETLNLVKGLGSGTGISNADREFAERASGGQITLDDRSMVRLMNVAKAAAGNVLMGHESLMESNKRASGAIPEDIDTMRVPFSLKANDQVDFNPRTRKFEVKAPPPAAATGAKPGSGGVRRYNPATGRIE